MAPSAPAAATAPAAASAPGSALLPALAGLVLGAALQVQQPALWAGMAYAALLLAAAAALAVVRVLRPALRGLAVLAVAACFAFALAGWRAAAFQARAFDPELEGRDLVVTGVVAAMPQRGSGGVRFRFDVEEGAAGLPPRLQLGWYGEPLPALRAGERWRFTVRLKAPHGHVNPHGADHALWLWEQGVQATGYVRPQPAQRLAATWRHPVEQARQAVRDALLARIADPRLAGILAALVTGDQAAIDRADWDVFRATGVAHLMSISGLHVTMFAWAAALAIGAAWRRSARACLRWPAPQAALAGGLVLATAYAVFSGWGVPAQRTLWMLAAVCVLRIAGARWPWPALWLLACALVVTVDPWALVQAGFWLSFVAVGVLFATERHGAAAPRGLALRARVAALLREQAVVTLALAPMTLLLFGQVSLVGLAANLAAIPCVTLLVTPLALLGVLAPPAWDIAAALVGLLGRLLQALAALPLAAWHGPAPPLWAGAAGVLGGLLLALRLPLALRALGVPLLLPVLLWQAPRPPHGEFELLAADVGQGTAVLVRTARHTLVYDAGPRYGPESDAGHRVLVPLLRALDERVDRLVLSHRDTDHTGGAAAVLAMQPQAQLVGSHGAGDGLPVPMQACAAGQHWAWDGVAFAFLHPPPDAPAGRPNAGSCVLRVDNGRRAALLTGDIEQPQEAQLVAAGAPLQADVLLVPHHGSRTSSSEAFLRAVQPTWALVQAGYRNRFGHPAAPVVERYERHGVALVASAQCGAATWSSQAPGALRCERAAAPRYWRGASQPPPSAR